MTTGPEPRISTDFGLGRPARLRRAPVELFPGQGLAAWPELLSGPELRSGPEWSSGPELLSGPEWSSGPGSREESELPAGPTPIKKTASGRPRRTGRTPRARRAVPAHPPGGIGRSRSAGWRGADPRPIR